MSITYKDETGIAGMRIAGKLASEVLDHLTPHVVPRRHRPRRWTSWHTTTS